MHPRLSIHGLWRLREEHLDGCVGRLNETFRRLADVTSIWGNWRRSYRSIRDREAGPVFLMEQPERIQQELLTYRTFLGKGRVDEELGYYLSASAGPVAGKGTEASHLALRCCVRTPYAFNELGLQLPVESAAPELYDVRLLSWAVAVLADVWDPDWLAVWDKLTKLVAEPWLGGPVLGWVNYLPTRTAAIEDSLPPGWRWFEGRGQRQIFIHEGGPPDEKNPLHRRAFQDMALRIRWKRPE